MHKSSVSNKRVEARKDKNTLSKTRGVVVRFARSIRQRELATVSAFRAAGWISISEPSLHPSRISCVAAQTLCLGVSCCWCQPLRATKDILSGPHHGLGFAFLCLLRCMPDSFTCCHVTNNVTGVVAHFGPNETREKPSTCLKTERLASVEARLPEG